MIKLADKHLAYRVTISGGEPFQQAVALKELILLLRAGGIKDILVYSGYPFKELRVRYPWIERSLSALVDGPFELAHPTDLAWKGSEGQKFYLFDPGLKESYDAWLGLKARRLQIIPLLEGVLVLGIPKLGDYQG
jgi:anaerobic ribonucleoside-triphosphate reductase activating protein